MISQAYIFLLTAISARVAYGLYKKLNMWKWIVLYWVTLTLKNAYDFISM